MNKKNIRQMSLDFPTHGPIQTLLNKMTSFNFTN